MTPYLLSYSDIKSLSERAIERFLSLHPQTDAYDIIDSHKRLHHIYKECAVQDGVDMSGKPTFENLCVDFITDYFSKDDRKSKRLKEAADAFALSDNNYYLEEEQEMDIRIQKLFTSEAKYKKYLQNCFVQ